MIPHSIKAPFLLGAAILCAGLNVLRADLTPLSVSADHRYLQDAAGQPFFLVGDCPQNLPLKLAPPEFDEFMADCQSKGFNLLWICLDGQYGVGLSKDRVPNNKSGQLMMTNGWDIGTLNAAYFETIDAILSMARKYELYCMLTPLSECQWIQANIDSNNPEKWNRYGRFLGARYKNQPHIIWQFGNDNLNTNAQHAIVAGIKAEGDRHLMTVNWRPGNRQFGSAWVRKHQYGENWIDLDALYRNGAIRFGAAPCYWQKIEYERPDPMPSFQTEAGYQQPDPRNAPDLDCRMQNYYVALGGGCGGQVYGAGFMADAWEYNSYKNNGGRVQALYFKNLFVNRAWTTLVPDYAHQFITAGYGTLTTNTMDYVGAAINSGTLGLAYCPKSVTITADLAEFSAPITARWYDPTDGRFQAIAGSPFVNQGSHPFTTPGKNSGRDEDWVLVLETQPTQAKADRPSAAAEPQTFQLLATLKREHPRLLATKADFTALKKRIAADPVLAGWHAAQQARANELLATAPPRRVGETKAGRRLANRGQVRSDVYTLAYMYRMEGDKSYAERAWQDLEAAARLPDWNPGHFLDTAEMTEGFAIGYDWLYEAWTPEQRQTLVQAIVNKGLKPTLPLYRERKGWNIARHNWNAVCNGGVGMGALAVAEVEPELAQEIVQGTLISLPFAVAEFAPDGAWKEGPGYWAYTTTYLVTYLAALETALGTDFGLSQSPGLDQTGVFPIYVTSPTGRSFNYADSGEGAPRPAQLLWLARKFQQPLYGWNEHQTKAATVQELLWFQPAFAHPQPLKLPLDKYFRGTEVATMRGSWDDKAAAFVGFKAGDNKANHSHLDIGTFVFDALGTRWAMGFGGDSYGLPGYFEVSTQRWAYYRVRAEGHNTLVIDPGAGPDQNPLARAAIQRFESRPDRAFAIADLTPAYASQARSVWRGVALLDRANLLVQDEIEAQNRAEVWWFLHTTASVALEENGRSALLSQEGKQARVQVLSPADARLLVMEAAPLPNCPNPPGQMRNRDVKKLAIHLDQVTKTRIAVALVPLLEHGSQPKPPSVTALSDW